MLRGTFGPWRASREWPIHPSSGPWETARARSKERFHGDVDRERQQEAQRAAGAAAAARRGPAFERSAGRLFGIFVRDVVRRVGAPWGLGGRVRRREGIR